MATGWKGTRWMYKLLPKGRNTIKSPILNSSVLIGRVMPSKTPYEKAARFDPKLLIKEDTSINVN